MGEPEVAVVYSPREWLEQLDRFVFDHGGARIRAKVVDRRDAIEEGYQVLVVDDFTAFLSRRFVDEVHRLDRRVLGVFDSGEVGGEEQLSGGLERLRQCGVDDVIEAGAPPSEFVAAVAALAESTGARFEAELGLVAPAEVPPERPAASEPTRGFVTVVAGPGGGCGATEIALAIGGSLARRGEAAIVVDADDAAPSLAQRLGLGLYPNLRAAIQAVEDEAGDLAANLVGVKEAGFQALAGLSRPRDWAAVRPFEVAEVIRSLALIRQQVVVNAGHHIEDLSWLGQPERFGVTRHLLSLADSLVAVGRGDPVGVARLLEWVAEARTLAPGTPMHLVVNRCGRGPFRRGEVEEEIRRAADPATLAFVPADERVEQAAWAGVPVPRGPFTRAVDGLVQVAAEGLKALKQQTSGYLSGLSPEQLQALAAEQGFEHPTLVGLTEEPGAQHPLVHWLDPVYAGSIPSKLKIQAKAAERYAQLAAGESIAGLSLADLQAAEAGFTAPPPPGAWEATPVEVVAAMAGLNQALADLDWHAVKQGASDGGLGALVAAENHLAAAQCPEMGGQLDAAKASAKAAVDKSLLAPSYMRNLAIDQVAAAAHDEGRLSFAEAKLLTRDEQLGLLRASTSHLERQGIAKIAGERAAEFDKLKGLYAAHKAAAAKLPQLSLGGPDAQQELVSAAKTTAAYFAQRQQVVSWVSGLAGTQELQAEAGPLHGLTSYDAATITSTFRTWAKNQKLADLKAAAQDLGMETAGASRAQVQNYIAASWDPKYDQASIAAAVGAGKGASAGPVAPKPVPKTVSTSSAPLSSGAVLAGGAPKSFATKHLQVVAALKAHQAITADLPPRPDQADVDGWSFGPGKAATLGGAHAKSVHAAPDGTLWLFKPDKTNHGARAHAEAAASEFLHRVGVPSVGVYVKKVGGQVGSIQPLVSGASSLPSDPKAWSQAEVDAVVRYHVAAWAVGDHDGNHTNILRTPSGGLLPVDQGQAFKFYGSDRLDASYHPNGTYGAAPPVFHQAYEAGKSGLLAQGVAIRPEAALPVIRAFERIPDAQYRAILGPVAAEGVKHKVGWVGPIRKAAQKRFGKTSVTGSDIAEEFLRQALERKNGLRKAFASFFSDLGYASGSKLEKVA